MKLATASTFIILLLVGCSNPDPIPMGPNVYLISSSDAGGPWADPSSLKAKVMTRANRFAESKGKVAIPLSTNERPGGFGRIGNCEYQFKLVDPNSPEAQQGNHLVPTAPVQKIETKIVRNDDVKVETKDTTEKKKDVYVELMKLDDLRKKGIITDAEFAAQKKRLLEAN